MVASVLVGTDTFTFTPSTESDLAATSNSTGITGLGTITDITSGDSVAGAYTFTFNKATIGGTTKFSFSVTDVAASVPDGGTTVMLLGAALSGIALIRRKLA